MVRLSETAGRLVNVSKIRLPGLWSCAGPEPGSRARQGWAEAWETQSHSGGTRESQKGGQLQERESARARENSEKDPVRDGRTLPRAFEDAEKRAGAEGGAEQPEERQRDAEAPKGWPGTGRSGETSGPRDGRRESAGGEGERTEPGGGGRRASRCRPFDPPLLLLIRSAFGDTVTKAVHHITARPGGSLRSRRLIRGEPVGPAGRAGGRPRGGGPGSALRAPTGVLERGRPVSLAPSELAARGAENPYSERR